MTINIHKNVEVRDHLLLRGCTYIEILVHFLHLGIFIFRIDGSSLVESYNHLFIGVGCVTKITICPFVCNFFLAA